jgi:Flp pilus assembly protein CpaB
VKKQTLILVVIGVILFLAGSALAYASVEGAKKSTTSTNGAATPTTTSAVVAKKNIPAGTTGAAMEAEGLVALELVPTKSFSPTDLTSLQGLSDEVLSGSVQKGSAISTTELTVSTQSISIPQGLDAMTVAIGGPENLAGYLQPGSHVDIYGNITKISSGAGAAGTSASLPIPCTELAMTNIEVMDVSSTSPSLAQTKGGSTTGRTVPGSETLLLALIPSQARTLEFLSQNESISVVQPDQEIDPPPIDQCIGTDQTTGAP